MLAARYLLEDELFIFLEDIFWTGRDTLWVQFGPMVIGAFFAGALGAALGILLNMRRHAAKEYGYFDRKYGLRGLMLPLLGAMFGLLLALLWAAVCYFLVWIAPMSGSVCCLCWLRLSLASARNGCTAPAKV